MCKQFGFQLANYGQKRDVRATDEELEIFGIIHSITGREDLELVRRSDNYVTAAIGDWDVARFKFTPRAKWIRFTHEVKSPKHPIEAPADVEEMSDMVMASLEHVMKFI